MTGLKAPTNLLTDVFQSFDDQKQLFKTSVDWSQSASVDTGIGRQDTIVQIEELAKDTDSTCEFICRVGKILCTSGEFVCCVGKISCTSGKFECRMGRMIYTGGRFVCRMGQNDLHRW